jgi:LysM repeat protein
MTELDPASPPEGSAAQSEGSTVESTDAGEPVAAASEGTVVSAPVAHDAAALAEPAAGICPYLRSADGTWRSTQPQPDHRCWAQNPPEILATLTQARLCLTADHVTCDLYGAAVSRRTQELERDHIPAERLSGRFNPQVQPVALALDAPVGGSGSSTDSRRVSPLLLIGVLLVLLVVVGAGYMAFGRGAATPTGSPPATPPASALAAAPPSSSAADTLAPSGAPSAAPSGGPSNQPSLGPSVAPTAPSLPPGVARTYIVRAGDTIHSIARRFHLTRGRLIAANELGNPPTITPGQVLFIPFPQAQASPSPAPS